MSFRSKSLPIVIIVMLFIMSCGRPSTDYSFDSGNLPSYYIKINDDNFYPADLRVSAGATVTFVNKTGKIQTIQTKENPLLLNTTIEPDKTFILKSDTAVVIKYYLKDIPNMQGLLVFRP